VKALELDDELQKAVHGQINRDIETQLQKKNFAAALSLAEGDMGAMGTPTQA